MKIFIDNRMKQWIGNLNVATDQTVDWNFTTRRVARERTDDSLDLSVWFCRAGEKLAREVEREIRCIERSGSFRSDTQGQLLFAVADQLWHPGTGSSRGSPRKGRGGAGGDGPPCEGVRPRLSAPSP